MTPQKTTVNVYNATNRNGLAASVSKGLEARGFVIGKVANDPSKRKAPPIAEVRHGPVGKVQAQLVLSALPKGATVVADKRKAAVVDVALGAKSHAAVRDEDELPMCPAPSPPSSPSASRSPSPASTSAGVSRVERATRGCRTGSRLPTLGKDAVARKARRSS